MSHDVYFTEPFYSDDGTAIMTACVSVYNSMNRKVGALCGAINLSAIQEVITDSEMLFNGDCFMVDRNGTFVTVPKSENLQKAGSLYDLKKSDVSLVQQAFLWEDHRGGVLLLEEEEYLAQVCYLPDYTWAIVQCTPMEGVIRQFENLTSLQIVLFLAILALVFCIIRIIYCWYKSLNETYRDPLTGCYNRAACIKMLSYLEKKTAVDIFLVFMDLNRFKEVNDNFGHDKGDLLLRIFSRELGESFGKIGFSCRVGGDEFVTVLQNSSEEEIDAIWELLCARLKEESKKLDFSYEITGSYGVAVRKKGETTSLDALMQLADERMYQHKAKQKR